MNEFSLKLLKYILRALALLSVITILIIFWELSSYSFLFSPVGFKMFICEFNEYSYMFSATLAVFVANLAIESLKTATQASEAAIEANNKATVANETANATYNAALEANEQRKKENRYADWKLVMEYAFIYSDKRNPYMKIEFTRVRPKLFDDLYQIDFNISSNEVLTGIFNTHFKNLAKFFEDMHERPDLTVPYQPDFSYDAFEYIFKRTVDEYYDNFYKDLKELYQKAMTN